MKIFKYRIKETDYQEIEMPEGAVILSIQNQYGNLQMWAKVDESRRLLTRRFRIIGTGNHFNDEGLTYIDTVKQDGYVWHIFEEERR